MFEALYRAILGDQQKQAPAQQIAKHLARVALFELKGVDALYPDVRDKCNALMARMKYLGKPVYLVEGVRTAKRQNDLYNQATDGKDNDGDGKIDEADEKVSNAKGLQSYHNYGLAFDLVFTSNGYNAPDADWKLLGAEGQKLGLDWGGSWTSFIDRPHFEYRPLNVSWTDLAPYFA